METKDKYSMIASAIIVVAFLMMIHLLNFIFEDSGLSWDYGLGGLIICVIAMVGAFIWLHRLNKT